MTTPLNQQTKENGRVGQNVRRKVAPKNSKKKKMGKILLNYGSMSHQHAFKNNVGFIKINMRFTNIYNHKFMVETKRVWYSSNIRIFFF